MKKLQQTRPVAFLLIAIGMLIVTVHAQRTHSSKPDTGIFTAERRPFDYSDDYYAVNGIISSAMTDRRSGSDGWSVVEDIYDANFRSVRILAVKPAYGAVGELLFLVPRGELFRDAFSNDPMGERALTTAKSYPIYMFPSALNLNSDRQAALVETDADYTEKNPIGLGLAILVTYTAEAETESSKKLLEELALRNGISLDGTPIIKTAREVSMLTRLGIVRQTVRGTDDPTLAPYVVARIIDEPSGGTISPDAFILNVKQANGRPLKGEAKHLEYFNCLQTGEQRCRR